MHKDDLKDFLFDILNEHDTIFTDISLDDETDTIFIKSVDGENFIVTVPCDCGWSPHRTVGKEKPGINVSCP